MHSVTPTLESVAITHRYSRIGAVKEEHRLDLHVLLKLDILQPAGSFKIRGIGYLCEKAVKEKGAKRFICSSGGNAGYAVAYAGKRLGIPVTVVVPETTLGFMRRRIENLGAQVIVEGKVWLEANNRAMKEMEKDPTATFVHPFDHPDLWEGHASIVKELKTQLTTKPAAILCAVGGGGLLVGIVNGLKSEGWDDVPVVAVETKGANSFSEAVRAGKVVKLRRIQTIATSLGATYICDAALEAAKSHPVYSLEVSDRQVVDTCLTFAEDHRMLAEPSCAAALTVAYNPDLLLSILPNITPGSTIVVVVCGGHIVTIDQLMKWNQEIPKDNL